MFRTLRTIWYLVGRYFETLGLFHKVKKMEEEEKWRKGYEYLNTHSPELVQKTGSRVVYHGLENIPEGSGIYFVGNHQSYFDIPILYTVMPERYSSQLACIGKAHVIFRCCAI